MTESNTEPLREPDRYDLPKGHMEMGENEEQTALRELMEETGIVSTDIVIDPTFRHEEVYYPIYARFGGATVKKTVVYFLAKLKEESVKITPTEHVDFEWMPWNSPPKALQKETVDPLVQHVYQHLQTLAKDPTSITTD